MGMWLLGLFWGGGHCPNSVIGRGCVALAENSCIGLLDWFPAQAKLWDGLHRCLGFCSGFLDSGAWVLDSAVSGGYELASLPWKGSRIGPRVSTVYCFRTKIRQEQNMLWISWPGNASLLCGHRKPPMVLPVQVIEGRTVVLWIGSLVR